MPDPNDLLAQIQMVCGDVAKSKTSLGYSQDQMTRLGMIAFGRADELRDAIQAPDGQSWRAALMHEAAKRLPLEAEIDRLRKAIKSFANADVEYLRAQHTGEQPRLNKAGTRYACAKHRLFKTVGLRG